MDYYLYSVCKNSVLNQHKAVCCEHYNQWVHIRCNNLNGTEYNHLKSKNKNCYCILCTSEILSFCQINEKTSIPKGNLNKPTGALVNLMNQLNNFTVDEKENELNLLICKYRVTDYLTKDFKRRDVCSFTKKFDDFNILLSELNVSFDILAITESRISKELSSSINLQLNNYSNIPQLNCQLVGQLFILVKDFFIN